MALAKGGSITLVGSVAAYVLGMAFNILVARRIGAGQYGLYALGVSLTTLIATFASLGLATGAQRFIAIQHHDGDDARVRGTIRLSLALILAVGAIASGVLYLLAGAIATRFFHNERMTEVIQVIGLAVPFLVVINVGGKMTQAFGIMRYRVYVQDLFQSAFKIALGIAFLAAGWQLRAVLLAYLIPTVAAALLMLVALTIIYPSWLGRRGETRTVVEPRRLLRFSVPLHMSNVMNDLYGRTELLLLGALGTAHAAGIYNVSLRVSVLGALLVNATIAVASPMIARLHHRKDIGELAFVFKLLTKWLILTNLPIALTIVILAKPLLGIFGGDFTQGVLVLSLLAVSRFIDAATGIGGTLINMIGRTDVALFNAGFALTSAIALDLLLIPRFGLIGAGVADLLAFAAINAVRLIQIYRWFGFHPYSRQLWKLAVAGGVGGYSAFIIHAFVHVHSDLALGAITAAVLWATYGLTVIALGLDESDLVVTRAARRKLANMLPQLGKA